jgi:hypothetical protein
MVSAMAALHNNGPAGSILVNATFTLTLPADCFSPTNNLTVTVMNRNLPASIAVNVARNWNVICSNTGDHQFNVTVTSVISSGQAWAEANPANNSGTGSATTFVAAPTPTPSPTPAP